MTAYRRVYDSSQLRLGLLVTINEVTLRRPRLVLGWATVRELESRSHRLGI